MSKDSKNRLPLTQSQLSLWAGQRMNTTSPLHHVVFTFDISGAVNEALFKKAFQRLVGETDALRLVFSETDGTPYQSVLATVDYDLEVLDFSGNPEDTQMREWIARRTEAPMSLSERVFDSVLLKRTNTRYIWYLKVHHLATDAVSTSLLYRRMLALYLHLSGKKDLEATTAASFSEYVSYESGPSDAFANTASDAYWKGKLAQAPVAPELYGQKNKTAQTSATRVSVRLNAERQARLRQLAKHKDLRSWTEDLSLFTLFTTLFAIYLHRVGGESRLAIGAPAHNRGDVRFRETVGLFIEVLPLFADIGEDDTFNTLYQRIKTEINGYLRHVGPGTATPETGRSFNAVLNYLHIDFPDFDGHPTRAEWITSGHVDSSHAIRCHVFDFRAEGSLEIAFDLNRGLFSDAIAHRVPAHFLAIFDALLKDRDLPIGHPSLVTAEEREILLGENDSPTPKRDENQVRPGVGVLEAFEQQAARRPNAVAVQCGSEVLTYAALNRRAERLAGYLIDKDVRAGQRVALHLRRSSEYLIAILGVMKRGAAFIPIASDQPAERVDYIVSNSACSLVLTEKSFEEVSSGPPASSFGAASDLTASDLTAINEMKVAKDFSTVSGPAVAMNSEQVPIPSNTAYVLYTSGSTGRPKGVEVSHGALFNYMTWAGDRYGVNESSALPLFTSIGFDLTLTATLLPLLNGGRVIIYPEKNDGIDLTLMQVLEDNLIDTIKLTPSHLALLQEREVSASGLRTIIVGGEQLKTGLAEAMRNTFPKGLKIYNEYGPTEATIGCIVGEYRPDRHTGTSVPIGKPVANMQAMVFDGHQNLVPQGVVGELYLSGTGLASGYVRDSDLTSEKFLEHPFKKNVKMYRTGDLARVNSHGEFEYLGRTDDQIKLRGHRIEPAEIEAVLASFPGIENSAIVVVDQKEQLPEDEVVNCIRCGLPSNYPRTDFDEHGVCHLCSAFENYRHKVERYFKDDDELVRILTSRRGENQDLPTEGTSRSSGIGTSEYDCISLLSGGKDSTYVLARLVNMGLKVLAFTMDNGYISDQAKANVDRIVAELGVDHIYGKTPHMNEIFVDSLHRHHNVCNGCFKTIYTLSTQIALDKNIPFIVTGLSRGQFFETRLTEELFWDDVTGPKKAGGGAYRGDENGSPSGSSDSKSEIDKIDQTILEARKLYHREPDAVKNLLDVSAFETDTVFEKVQFVDFYRYSDVSLEDMLAYLENKIGWVRPTDTGRSTNCLINQVGIYVHKKEEGYSNYAFPYSWDVRLGHKKRDESLEEINEAIDEIEVKRIMEEIGYDRADREAPQGEKLVAYFTGDPEISVKELRDFLSKKLPAYMVPTAFKHLGNMPLTPNAKVDKKALQNLNSVQLAMDTPFVAPRNDIEELLEDIWKEVLQLEKIGVHDDFLALGGHSLAAIRVTARINGELETEFPLSKVFEFPTIAEYAFYIEKTLTELLKA